MLRFVLFDTTAWGPGDDSERTEKNIMWMLEALVQRNQEYLKQRPNTKRLYRSGVTYKQPQQFAGEVEEVKALRAALGKAAKFPHIKKALETVQDVLGGERFRDIGRIIENGGGDCDNLACWRAAELRQGGIPNIRPYMTKRRRADGGMTYHALVIWPSLAELSRLGLIPAELLRGRDDTNYETSEDSSLLLGMGGDRRKRDRLEEIRKNRERCDLLRAAKSTVARPAPLVAPVDLLEDVLGLRAARPQFARGADSAVTEIDRLLRRVA